MVFSLDPHFRRIIPAYAGSTRTATWCSRKVGDHPRIRGEHSYLDCSIYFTNGSSPHTRGARCRRVGELGLCGIIPAYAGSTRKTTTLGSTTTDHPRIRGEHAEADGPHYFPVGSSPHTRGARVQHQPVKAQPRIIPAYAGSTLPPDPRKRARKDHPRIRGEHLRGGATAIGAIGSSPHTRGAPGAGTATGAGLRIIPAYAGST